MKRRVSNYKIYREFLFGGKEYWRITEHVREHYKEISYDEVVEETKSVAE